MPPRDVIRSLLLISGFILLIAAGVWLVSQALHLPPSLTPWLLPLFLWLVIGAALWRRFHAGDILLRFSQSWTPRGLIMLVLLWTLTYLLYGTMLNLQSVALQGISISAPYLIWALNGVQMRERGITVDLTYIPWRYIESYTLNSQDGSALVIHYYCCPGVFVWPWPITLRYTREQLTLLGPLLARHLSGKMHHHRQPLEM